MTVFEAIAFCVWLCGFVFAVPICWRSSDGNPAGILASALWPLWLPFYANIWDDRLDAIDPERSPFTKSSTKAD